MTEVLILPGARQETVQLTDQVRATRVPRPGIILLTGQVQPAAVPLRVILSQRLPTAGQVITAAVPVQALPIAVEAVRVQAQAQAQAGLPIPHQEAAQVMGAHPGVAAIGLHLAAAHREAATGLPHPAAAHLPVAAALPVAADHLQVEAPEAAGPAVEEDNSRFILSHNRKIDFGLIQGKYI